jgi:hypothetical protein
MLKIRRAGMRQLEGQLSDGLEAVADQLLAVCKATSPVELVRDPAITRDSLHTDKTHSREWPKPAVFVATASGDGFFVHEGTVDTVAQPWMSQALDGMIRQIPSIIRSETKGRDFGITRR